MKKLDSFKRIVIKIGSALLVDKDTGHIHQAWLKALLSDIAEFQLRDQEIVIVTSGAVAIGRQQLKGVDKKLRLQESQAAAAIGQIRLAHAYQAGLAAFDIPVAQILLTLEDTENRRRYINASNTLDTLLQHKVIPIINENDTIATHSIRYGDNDRLAARIAQMVNADLLILLSDIDGLYTADPNLDPNAQLILTVTEIDNSIWSIAGKPLTPYGSGGMHTKIAAAEIAMSSGCHMLIAKGKPFNPLKRIIEGAPCTWFIPKLNPEKAHKNWLRQHLQIKGRIIIDEGAILALHQGRSLLAAGIIGVEGDFQKGDAVNICKQQSNGELQEIARGLSYYSVSEARQIAGKHSQEIITILGYNGGNEVVHRCNLVIL